VRDVAYKLAFGIPVLRAIPVSNRRLSCLAVS
jgi:hypothetical protein